MSWEWDVFIGVLVLVFLYLLRPRTREELQEAKGREPNRFQKWVSDCADNRGNRSLLSRILFNVFAVLFGIVFFALVLIVVARM